MITKASGGVRPMYYRAPGGAFTPYSRHLAASQGMRPLGWNVDSKDFERPGTEAIVATVKNELSNGPTILFHDAAWGPLPDRGRPARDPAVTEAAGILLRFPGPLTHPTPGGLSISDGYSVRRDRVRQAERRGHMAPDGGERHVERDRGIAQHEADAVGPMAAYATPATAATSPSPACSTTHRSST